MSDLVQRLRDNAQGITLGADGMGWSPCPALLGQAADALESQAGEIGRLRKALLQCARQAEALKQECPMDPENAQSIRNARYQLISVTAHIALGTIRGPDAAKEKT